MQPAEEECRVRIGSLGSAGQSKHLFSTSLRDSAGDMGKGSQKRTFQFNKRIHAGWHLWARFYVLVSVVSILQGTQRLLEGEGQDGVNQWTFTMAVSLCGHPSKVDLITSPS